MKYLPIHFRLIGLSLFMMSSLFLSAAIPDGWSDDYLAASVLADKNGQNMLFLFTGSDWCVWCKKLHEEILDTDVFKEWAGENIILIYVDFPRNDYRSEATREQNSALDEKFDVSGYPTAIITDSSGKELTRLSYMQGGPKTFIRAIQRAGH